MERSTSSATIIHSSLGFFAGRQDVLGVWGEIRWIEMSPEHNLALPNGATFHRARL